MTTFVDSLGRVMVGEPAGGAGGGVTSFATRPATPEEITAFHANEVEVAQAALDAAKVKRDDHHKQDVVIGAVPPPGPLDPSSLVAQGAVGTAGNPDPRLGQPLGGHTEQQGQPQQATDAGTPGPSIPDRVRDPESPPPHTTSTTSGAGQMTPRGGPGSVNPGSGTTPGA